MLAPPSTTSLQSYIKQLRTKMARELSQKQPSPTKEVMCTPNSTVRLVIFRGFKLVITKELVVFIPLHLTHFIHSTAQSRGGKRIHDILNSSPPLYIPYNSYSNKARSKWVGYLGHTAMKKPLSDPLLNPKAPLQSPY